MAKRQPPGGGRKAPETDYNKEMRKAFERSNLRDNRTVDNRTLIPQLMRELVAVHGVRRAGPQQRGQGAPVARYKRRTPVPPRELAPARPQIPQAGPSFQGGQRSAVLGPKWAEYIATRHPRAREVIQNLLRLSKASNPAREGRSLRSYIRGRQQDSGDTFECIDATDLRPEDAVYEDSSSQLSPEEQFELDTMLAIERSLEECYTTVATHIPAAQVHEKDEGISFEEMTVEADVHCEGATAMEFASGGQIPSQYPIHRATAEQLSSEPEYAVPRKKKDYGAPEVDTTEYFTPSSDSSSDRPPTPHPRSWLPVPTKYHGGNYPQNIYQQQEYEDKRQMRRQHILTDDEKFQLDTQLAIQHSLQDAYMRANDKFFGEDEIVMVESQEKQINHCDSGMSHIGLPQQTHRNMHTPISMSAQYDVSDDSVMGRANGESKTNNVPGTIHTSPPKPARLYVRGVNTPPGMNEQYAVSDDAVMLRANGESKNKNVPGTVHTSPPKPARLYVRGVNAPPGINEQHAVSDDAVMLRANGESKTNNVPGAVQTSPPKPPRLYVRGVNAPPGMMEPISSVVPRISNVQCPPPENNDQVWENIIPPTPDALAGPQEDPSPQQQPSSCCELYMESFTETVNSICRCFRLLGNYIRRYLCHCEPIPGTCAYNN